MPDFSGAIYNKKLHGTSQMPSFITNALRVLVLLILATTPEHEDAKANDSLKVIGLISSNLGIRF